MRLLLIAAAALMLCACDEAATEAATAEADDTAVIEDGTAADATEPGEGAATEDAADAAETPEPEPARAPEKAPDPWQQVTIAGFECGDNCYLVYERANTGEAESALCNARACNPWFEMQEMPADMIGRKIRVRFGSGQQVDGSGNVMSDDFPAVTDIWM